MFKLKDFQRELLECQLPGSHDFIICLKKHLQHVLTGLRRCFHEHVLIIFVLHFAAHYLSSQITSLRVRIMSDSEAVELKKMQNLDWALTYLNKRIHENNAEMTHLVKLEAFKLLFGYWFLSDINNKIEPEPKRRKLVLARTASFSRDPLLALPARLSPLAPVAQRPAAAFDIEPSSPIDDIMDMPDLPPLSALARAVGGA